MQQDLHRGTESDQFSDVGHGEDLESGVDYHNYRKEYFYRKEYADACSFFGFVL